jgi:hypothetical protein
MSHFHMIVSSSESGPSSVPDPPASCSELGLASSPIDRTRMLIPAKICESSCGQIVDHYSVQNMYYDVVNGFISLSLFMLCFFFGMFVHPLFLPFMLQPLK